MCLIIHQVSVILRTRSYFYFKYHLELALGQMYYIKIASCCKKMQF